jgi:ribosome-binding ATPase YchF (GTP1/OBG family)
MARRAGLVGKPSVGKSTFFNAATMSSREQADYPFTTTESSVGRAFVRVEDPGPELEVESQPNRGFVENGTRFVPVDLVDIPGLVPDAHEGRGMGNQFLSDLNRASALIHVIDLSGGTDAEGNPAEGRDPARDIEFLESEIDRWYLDVLERGLSDYDPRDGGSLAEAVSDRMRALGVSESQVENALDAQNPRDLSDGDRLDAARELRRQSKPMLVAANKADVSGAMSNLEGLGGEVVPCSAKAEHELRKAAEADAVNYVPGDSDFDIVGDLSGGQRGGLEEIRELMEELGGTGVQQVLDSAYLDLLGLVPVFPVRDGLEDGEGNTLPDCFLMPPGSDVEDLAERVHSEVAESMLHGVDCRTGRRLGSDAELSSGDVVRIVTS